MVPQERFLDRARGLPRRRRRLPVAAAVLSVALALGACGEDRTPALLGTWQAELLVEEGDTVDVDLADVSLAFAGDQRYIYTSTLDHLETGDYTLEGDLLTTTADTVDGTGAGPQRVRVITLDSARLHLLMMDQGKQRRLEFVRVGLQAPPPPGVAAEAPIDSTLLFEENFDEEDFGAGEAIDDHDHDHDH